MEAQKEPHALLDFGCNDGVTMPMLLAALRADSAIGNDVSAESLAIATKSYATMQIRFESIGEFQTSGKTNLDYCNGVFHYIASFHREEALAPVTGPLRIEGLFSFWERNPISLATR
jgi:trans-aconitate methyltransferase